MQSFTIKAPARLHLGFLDISGTLGRRFGSLGLAVNSHHLMVVVQPSDTDVVVIETPTASPAFLDRAERLCQQFYQSFGQQITTTVKPRFRFEQLIPEHAGLGSGTQLAITLGRALARFYQLDISTAEIARTLGRGNRSGIGISTFDTGGFIVDGGLAADSSTPALLTRMAFPQDWRIVMLMDHHNAGVHGEQETNAFRDLPPFPEQRSQIICHLTLMQLLPALVEQKIHAFGAAVTRIQTLIGEHFAPCQGGQFSSPRVASLLESAQQWGYAGIAQSSWGPTGCIFVDSDAQAQRLTTRLQAQLAAAEMSGIEIIVAAAQNQGAEIYPNF